MRGSLAVLFAALLAGCALFDGPVAIQTRPRPDDMCLQARLGGTLVADATYGLALENPGYRMGVVWPFGFTARRESGVIVLLGPSGNVIAREGDRIQAGGGSAGDDAVGVCGTIQVNPSPGA